MLASDRWGQNSVYRGRQGIGLTSSSLRKTGAWPRAWPIEPLASQA